MLILGLDPSQSTGWALYDTAASLSAIRAGTLRAVGDDYEHKSASLGQALMRLIKADKPDFIVIERPLRTQPGGGKKKLKFMGEETDEKASGSGMNAVISSNQMVGSIAGIIGAFNLPFETIDSQTWRGTAYGFGRRPGWERKDWKRHAREKCSQVKITVTNDDMAEAVWIAFAGKACQTCRMLEARAAA